jgi:uncharacterized protein involved in exopolysaccharide biosynthesis
MSKYINSTDERLNSIELELMEIKNFNESVENRDEIDLKELLNAVWAGKWIIISITFISTIISVFYALSVPNEYKSTALLAPASQSSGAGGLSKLAGQFGGLASLAGINVGSGGDDKSVIAMEIVKTWGFLDKFIKDNEIEVEVFAAEGWKLVSNELIINDKLYDEGSQKWVRAFDVDKGQESEPSSWELFEEIKDRINISQNKESGLISLTVEYYSPIIAKQWVDKLVSAINLHIQEQDRKDAIKSIAYLNAKIQETHVADMQAVFYQLIEEQTKTLMLTEVSDEYVFKTVSPAKIAEEKSKPKRFFICLIGVIIGVILSAIAVLIRAYKSRD